MCHLKTYSLHQYPQIQLKITSVVAILLVYFTTSQFLFVLLFSGCADLQCGGSSLWLAGFSSCGRRTYLPCRVWYLSSWCMEPMTEPLFPHWRVDSLPLTTREIPLCNLFFFFKAMIEIS